FSAAFPTLRHSSRDQLAPTRRLHWTRRGRPRFPSTHLPPIPAPPRRAANRRARTPVSPRTHRARRRSTPARTRTFRILLDRLPQIPPRRQATRERRRLLLVPRAA